MDRGYNFVFFPTKFFMQFARFLRAPSYERLGFMLFIPGVGGTFPRDI